MTSQIAALSLLVLVFYRWFSLRPSNERDWAPDVSKLPWAEVDGERVVIHNVRNFDYRSESDFSPRWETRTYDLSKLTGLDFAVSYWSGRQIAHVMTSFSFENRDFVAFSVETRKERLERYSAIKGFFRQYELIYIAADERDLFGLRTTYRNPSELVYLIRTRTPPSTSRQLFLRYLEDMNDLVRSPRFYNSITTNCTTQVLRNAKAFSPNARYSWRVLLSGHVPELLYQSGNCEPGLSLEQIMEKGLINQRSRAASHLSDYSQRIRAGLSGGPLHAPQR